jgi:hypothetical protein
MFNLLIRIAKFRMHYAIGKGVENGFISEDRSMMMLRIKLTIFQQRILYL